MSGIIDADDEIIAAIQEHCSHDYVSPWRIFMLNYDIIYRVCPACGFMELLNDGGEIRQLDEETVRAMNEL